MDETNYPDIGFELYNILKKSERYNSFIIANRPVKFKDLFAGIDIPLVQLHDTAICDIDGKKTIMGFSGVFEWKDGKIFPIDYDSNYGDIKICGYEWFERDGKQCLDILVVRDW